MAPTRPERIYTTQQLLEAVPAALAALHSQLGVLEILDATSESWPGLHESVAAVAHVSGEAVSRLLAAEKLAAAEVSRSQVRCLMPLA